MGTLTIRIDDQISYHPLYRSSSLGRPGPGRVRPTQISLTARQTASTASVPVNLRRKRKGVAMASCRGMALLHCAAPLDAITIWWTGNP